MKKYTFLTDENLNDDLTKMIIFYMEKYMLL